MRAFTLLPEIPWRVTITDTLIRSAKVGIRCAFSTFVTNFFSDTKRLLMKFDCFFIITETVIRSAKVGICCALVVRGVTTVQTNQKAGFRSRGTNGPISVQQEVM